MERCPLLHSCLYFTANALAREVTRLADDSFAETGLSPSHAFLVMVAANSPGIGPSELGDGLHLAPSTITRFIEALEHRGFCVANATAAVSLFTPLNRVRHLSLGFKPRGRTSTSTITACSVAKPTPSHRPSTMPTWNSPAPRRPRPPDPLFFIKHLYVHLCIDTTPRQPRLPSPTHTLSHTPSPRTLPLILTLSLEYPHVRFPRCTDHWSHLRHWR